MEICKIHDCLIFCCELFLPDADDEERQGKRARIISRQSSSHAADVPVAGGAAAAEPGADIKVPEDGDSDDLLWISVQDGRPDPPVGAGPAGAGADAVAANPLHPHSRFKTLTMGVVRSTPIRQIQMMVRDQWGTFTIWFEFLPLEFASRKLYIFDFRIECCIATTTTFLARSSTAVQQHCG